MERFKEDVTKNTHQTILLFVFVCVCGCVYVVVPLGQSGTCSDAAW